MTKVTEYVGVDCGHEAVRSGIGTGYATTPDGRRVCYPCADEMQREDMKTAGSMFAYLSGDHKTVTTWTGGKLGSVTRYAVSNGRWTAYSGLVHRVYVRVTDVHGTHWHGSGPLESGQYVNLHRSKV